VNVKCKGGAKIRRAVTATQARNQSQSREFPSLAAGWWFVLKKEKGGCLFFFCSVWAARPALGLGTLTLLCLLSMYVGCPFLVPPTPEFVFGF